MLKAEMHTFEDGEIVLRIEAQHKLFRSIEVAIVLRNPEII